MAEIFGDWVMSKHAATRCAQRAIRRAQHSALLAYADIERNARGGASRLQMSARSAMEAIADGIPAATIERARRINAICINGAVITAYKTRRSASRRISTWGL